MVCGTTEIARRPATARTAGSVKKMVSRPPHDADGYCGHAALDRAWIGHRYFLWLYAAVEHENAALDRCRMGIQVK